MVSVPFEQILTRESRIQQVLDHYAEQGILEYEISGAPEVDEDDPFGMFKYIIAPDKFIPEDTHFKVYRKSAFFKRWKEAGRIYYCCNEPKIESLDEVFAQEFEELLREDIGI